MTKNKAGSEHHMRETLCKSSRFEYQLKMVDIQQLFSNETQPNRYFDVLRNNTVSNVHKKRNKKSEDQRLA